MQTPGGGNTDGAIGKLSAPPKHEKDDNDDDDDGDDDDVDELPEVGTPTEL